MSFYTMLMNEMRREVKNREPSLYSQLRLNTVEWYKRVGNIENQLCLDNKFWLEFWRGKTVNKPTSKDMEHLKQLHNDDLNSLQLVLSVSLKYLIINHCGKTSLARNLNEYWIIGNEELKRRGFETLDFNPYDIDMKTVSEGGITELTKEQSQTEGICPNCLTKDHVISNGNMWKCKHCNRNFRKKS